MTFVHYGSPVIEFLQTLQNMYNTPIDAESISFSKSCISVILFENQYGKYCKGRAPWSKDSHIIGTVHWMKTGPLPMSWHV